MVFPMKKRERVKFSLNEAFHQVQFQALKTVWSKIGKSPGKAAQKCSIEAIHLGKL